MQNQAHIPEYVTIKLVKKDTFNTKYLLWKRNIDMHTHLPQSYKITMFKYIWTVRKSSTTQRMKKTFGKYRSVICIAYQSALEKDQRLFFYPDAFIANIIKFISN